MATYLTRSKTDTRLPTGEITELPSGEKSTFPWRYTVPHKLLNRKLDDAVAMLYPASTFWKVSEGTEKFPK